MNLLSTSYAAKAPGTAELHNAHANVAIDICFILHQNTCTLGVSKYCLSWYICWYPRLCKITNDNKWHLWPCESFSKACMCSYQVTHSSLQLNTNNYNLRRQQFEQEMTTDVSMPMKSKPIELKRFDSTRANYNKIRSWLIKLSCDLTKLYFTLLLWLPPRNAVAAFEWSNCFAMLQLSAHKLRRKRNHQY